MVEASTGKVVIDETKSSSTSTFTSTSSASSDTETASEISASTSRKAAPKHVKTEMTRRARNTDGARRQAELLSRLDKMEEKQQQADERDRDMFSKTIADAISKIGAGGEGGGEAMKQKLCEIERRQEKLEEGLYAHH